MQDIHLPDLLHYVLCPLLCLLKRRPFDRNARQDSQGDLPYLTPLLLAFRTNPLLERRRRYRDAAEKIVHGMALELETMRNGICDDRHLALHFLTGLVSDEIHLREVFYAEHGPHLPDDLCLCVANIPTRWEVGPAPGETQEELPLIDEDLLAEVCDYKLPITQIRTS